MKAARGIVAVVLGVLGAGVVPAAASGLAPLLPGGQAKTKVFLLIGQSNMAGSR